MITSTTRRYSTLLVIISLLILSLKIDVTKQQEETKERVLVVQAHPDDETYFGGLIYKTASDLQGVVDIVVVTDGQGGYNCSIVAEWHYHRKLTDPMIGRENLPFLRKQEMLNSARILSVRDVFFLGILLMLTLFIFFCFLLHNINLLRRFISLINFILLK